MDSHLLVQFFVSLFFPSFPAVTSMFPVIELQLPHVFFASSSLSFFAFASL